jgi:hypothetical protein
MSTNLSLFSPFSIKFLLTIGMFLPFHIIIFISTKMHKLENIGDYD